MKCINEDEMGRFICSVRMFHLQNYSQNWWEVYIKNFRVNLILVLSNGYRGESDRGVKLTTTPI